MSTFQERVVAACDRAVEATRGTEHHDEAVAARARATGPLRVAIAGRVKAGKSTLLNALVGERLAPTDAGECTLLVSEYREDLTYDVAAVLRDGSRRALTFQRDGDALEVELGDLDRDEVDRLDIGWPSSALRDLTLVDTPGLASLTADAQARTLDYLAGDESSTGQADAVLYLMRHLHQADASFLETFTDHSLANASPANAIAVLSRADEVGAGRPDAMDSARRIADRYAADPRVRALASRVVPVAGLLAETGLTLRQDEFAALDRIAREGDPTPLLASVDRFASHEPCPVAPEIRAELLDRFGLFGVRVAITAITDGTVSSGPDLARHLVEVSGLPRLRDLLAGHFTSRSTALRARSALAALRALGTRLPDGAALLREVEEIEATSHELAELRLVHLALAGATRLAAEEVDEVLRVTGGGSAGARLGVGDDTPVDELRTAALVAVDRWRTRRAHPMMDPMSAEACDILARSYEGLYASI